MRRRDGLGVGVLAVLCLGVVSGGEAPPPAGVKAVWDRGKVYRETTPKREWIWISRLCHRQRADQACEPVPADGWGRYRVPALWSCNSQTLHPHPAANGTASAAIQGDRVPARDSRPGAWRDRRATVYAEYLNSHAAVYLEGNKVGKYASRQVRSISP